MLDDWIQSHVIFFTRLWPEDSTFFSHQIWNVHLYEIHLIPSIKWKGFGKVVILCKYMLMSHKLYVVKRVTTDHYYLVAFPMTYVIPDPNSMTTDEQTVIIFAF